MVVRKLLDLVFSQHNLAWLDDILPDKDKKKKEDEKKKKEKKKAKADEQNSDEEVRWDFRSCDNTHAVSFTNQMRFLFLHSVVEKALYYFSLLSACVECLACLCCFRNAVSLYCALYVFAYYCMMFVQPGSKNNNNVSEMWLCFQKPL